MDADDQKVLSREKNTPNEKDAILAPSIEGNGASIEISSANVTTTTGVKAVPKGKSIGRRIPDEDGFFYVDDNSHVQATLKIFLENRPTGISVDVLWDSGSVSKSNKALALSAAKAICVVENWNTKGWCVFTVKALLKEVSEAVERVIYTDQPTNPNHAEIIVHDFVRITEADIYRKKKAKMIAKILYEFSVNHGEVQT